MSTLRYIYNVMSDENTRKNKSAMMGKESIGKLIMKVSLPIMISMLVQALYNIVDSIFVSWLSEEALAAVTLAYPLQNLMIAFAIGTAVGVNSLLSRRLGEGKEEEADNAGRNGIFLSILTWLGFALFGIIFAKPFLALFTEDDQLLSMALSYSRICLIASIGIFIEVTCERIMQASGDSFHSMITQTVGAIANIILDPIFIFTFKMGVAGAAIATVIGQIIAAILAVFFIIRGKHININMRGFKPKGNTIVDIYRVGFPTIITNSISTLMVSALNGILIAFSTTAVSVFGVYFKLQSFVFMPVFGLSAGLISIIGYNYGAKNRHRITETVRKGCMISFGIMAVGFLFFQLFPHLLLNMFNSTEQMYALGIPALRIISFCFLPASISIALGSAFQGTGIGMYTMIISILRQLGILVPAAYIMSKLFGIGGVWWAFSVSDIIGLALSITFYLRIYRMKIKPLSND